MPADNLYRKPKALKSGGNHAAAGGVPTVDGRPAEPSSESRVIRLSPEDQLSLARALITPPKPNAALRAAIAQYKALSRR